MLKTNLKRETLSYLRLLHSNNMVCLLGKQIEIKTPKYKPNMYSDNIITSPKYKPNKYSDNIITSPKYKPNKYSDNIITSFKYSQTYLM